MKFIPVKNLPKYLALVACLAFSNVCLLGQIDFEILSGDAQICAGDSTLLSIDASVDSVQWSPTTGVSMPNSLATFVAPAQSTTYFATLFSGQETTNVRFQVDVFSAPDLGSDIEVCAGAQLFYDFSELPIPTEYSLTSNPALAINEMSTNDFEVNTTNATGIIELIATSDCGQSDTIQITIADGTHIPVFINVIDDNFIVCPEDEVNLQASVLGGNPNFEWFANGTSISTQNSITENPIVTTTYVISVSDTMNCAVPTLDSVTITVNAPPSISLPETIMGCENDVIQLGNNITQVGTTYSWAPNDNIIDPNVVNAEVLVLEDETYILTASNGCEIQDTIEVTLIDNDLDIEMDTLFLCKGDSITIPFTTNPPQDDVVWTTIDGIPLVNVGTPFVVAPQDVVTFIGTVENNGCTHSDTVTIQVDSLPDFPDLELIELDMMPPICMGDTVLLQDNPVFPPNLFPDLTFQWFTGDTTAVPALPGQLDGFLTPDSLLQVLFQSTTSMQYVRLNINGACTSFSTIDVEVIPILEIDITPTEIVCPGTAFTLIPEVTDPTETPPRQVDPNDLEEWEWMASPGTIEPAEGEPEPLFTADASDANIMVTAEYMGCPTMGMANIPVYRTPIPIFPNSVICPGDLVSLNEGAVEPSFTFMWSSTANDLNGQENDPNPQVSPLTTTTYSVTITNADCDPVMDEVTISVFDQVGSIMNIMETACSGENVTLSIEGQNFDLGPNGMVTWVLTSTGESQTGLFLEALNVQQDQSYNLFVTNDCVQNQLIGTASIMVTQVPSIQIECDTMGAIFVGQEINLSAISSVPLTTYTWTSNPTLGGNFSNGSSPNTMYTVPDNSEGNTETITINGDLNGCPISPVSKVFAITDVIPRLPNIFTPGGSENRIFSIGANNSNGEIVEVGLIVSNLQIYDRWGNRVYDNDNPEQEWDGTIGGNPAPSEVYIYTVTYQFPGAEPITETRDLTLLR